MSNLIKAAALLTCLPGLSIPQALRWSEPTRLREPAGYYLQAYLASNANGSAIVLWGESNASFARGYAYVARVLTPGSEWGPATLVSDGSGNLEPPVAVAMGDDGTAIAAWGQFIEQPVFQSQVVVRKLVPSAGWGPIQVLSTFGIYPVVAIAPDGRAHIVYNENQSLVARTLVPGGSVWSPPVVVGENSGDAKLMVGSNFGYLAFRTSEFVSGVYGSAISLASYTADSWHPAVTVSDPNAVITEGPQLVANNGHVVVSWLVSDDFGLPREQWVQRVTDSSERFPLPAIGHSFRPGYPFESFGLAACPIALDSDGTVLAACPTRGEAVPDCQDVSRSGPVPAFYYHVQIFRRPVEGHWSSPEIVSDLQKRAVLSPRILANSFGDALVLWNSEVPCQLPNIQTPVSRLWRSSQAAWEPEAGWGTANWFSLGLTVDAKGTFRALWTDNDVDYNRTPQVFSTLMTAELVTHSPPTADLNGDGVVDCIDLSIVRAALGAKLGEPGYNALADTNQDGVVDVRDLAFVAQQLPPGTQCQ